MLSSTNQLKNVKLYYIDTVRGSPIMGRGEYVRLLLEDSGIDFEYVRHTQDEWKKVKQQLIDSKTSRDPTMPYMTIDGEYYSKALPLMRFISRKLGKYEGSNEKEAQLVDAYADLIMDRAMRWALATFDFLAEQHCKDYRENYAPGAYKMFEEILSDTEGPYLLGDKISYADFVLYHMMEDDGSAIDATCQPHLFAFKQAIENRPNIKKYFATGRK